MAHFREIGHYRAFMGPTVITYDQSRLDTRCATRAQLLPIYYNAVFSKFRKRKTYNWAQKVV
jgi:hypothetical protein